ncbi:MAG: hypothetical protein KA146_05050 [Leptospiraceae bacterium]|jgi:hypothetical protein|nr:hypothetical protein [Leptospiraceae bacterium]
MLVKMKKMFGFYRLIIFLSFFCISLKAEESVLFIEWENNHGATQYLIEISDSKKFNKILFSKKVEEAVILIEPVSKYKFGRIAGIDKFGSIGKFSEIFPLRPRVIASKKIPTAYKETKVYQPSPGLSNVKLTKESENLKKISDKRIRIKEREKANYEIFSKLIDAESSLNLILKNIYMQRYKLNELELEILKSENLDEKDFGRITNEANQILDSLKDADRETASLVTPIEREAMDSQKNLSLLKREIETMNGLISPKAKKEKSENNQKIEDKYSELKTYCEEEMERMEDLLREIKSLQKKKTHIAKQIKNFKKEIIYFQSTTEDLKKQK